MPSYLPLLEPSQCFIGMGLQFAKQERITQYWNLGFWEPFLSIEELSSLAGLKRSHFTAFDVQRAERSASQRAPPRGAPLSAPRREELLSARPAERSASQFNRIKWPLCCNPMLWLTDLWYCHTSPFSRREDNSGILSSAAVPLLWSLLCRDCGTHPNDVSALSSLVRWPEYVLGLIVRQKPTDIISSSITEENRSVIYSMRPYTCSLLTPTDLLPTNTIITIIIQ